MILCRYPHLPRNVGFQLSRLVLSQDRRLMRLVQQAPHVLRPDQDALTCDVVSDAVFSLALRDLQGMFDPLFIGCLLCLAIFLETCV